MNNGKNKYRITLYIGKENYERLEPLANLMQISVSALARVMFDTGMQIAKIVDQASTEVAEVVKNGKSKE